MFYHSWKKEILAKVQIHPGFVAMSTNRAGSRAREGFPVEEGDSPAVEAGVWVWIVTFTSKGTMEAWMVSETRQKMLLRAADRDW